MFIKPSRSLKGEIHIPGDKSISHRSVMFGALADGLTEVTHFLHGADCLSTISCFKQLGVPVENTKDCIRIYGKAWSASVCRHTGRWKQRYNHPSVVRYSCRTAICLHADG